MKLTRSAPVSLGLAFAAYLSGVQPVAAAPYLGLNVGNPSLPGTAVENGPTLTLEGSGSDIWGTEDQFYLHYITLPGEGSVVARVAFLENTDPWAKAGVMIRASGDANSVHAFMGVTAANDLAFQRRTATGQGSEGSRLSGAAPQWVRLTRLGNLVTASHSVDGVVWSQAGSVSLPLHYNALFGFAVTSHNSATLATAVFENAVVEQGAAHLNMENMTWTDNGNGDGRPDPGEELTFTLRLRNIGSATARSVRGSLVLNNPHASLITGDADFGTIPVGGLSDYRQFRFRVSPEAPRDFRSNMLLVLKDSWSDYWRYIVGASTSVPLTISGTVRWDTGEPVANAHVECANKGSLRFQNTDAQGHYNISILYPGPYTCWATYNGSVSSHVPLGVPPSLTNVDFTLAKP